MSTQKQATAMENKISFPQLPFRVEFDTSGFCNLSCAYCYAQPLANVNPSKETLQYLFAKTKAEVKPFEVLLLGGEPFMRKDIVEVLEIATDTFKHDVAISTNGTHFSRFTEGELERLKETTNKGLSIQVSIDSADPAINDITRGRTLETLNGMDILEKHGILFAVGMVITSANMGDILKTISYMGNKYEHLNGLNFEVLQASRNRLKSEAYDNLTPDKAKLTTLYADIFEAEKQLRRDDVKFLGLPDKPLDNVLFESSGLTQCTAGLMRSAVMVNGDVTPCANIRYVTMGNLFKESWSEIWGRARERFFALDMIGCQCDCLLRKGG